MKENNSVEQYKNALFYLEQGDTQNIYKAIELLTLAAEKGNAEAQCRLGRLYAEGEFVAEDFKIALYWLKEAAEQGYTEAEDKLSSYLIELIRRDYRSNRVGRDYRNRFTISDKKPFLDENEILSWLEKTTLTNNPKIQYNIGKLYFLKFDFEEEKEWLTKSAEQDYEEAIIELIGIYNDKYEKYNCNLENLCYWLRKAFSLGIDLKIKNIALNKTAVFLLEKEIDPDFFFDSNIDYTAIKIIRDNSPLTINFIKQWLLDNGFYYDEEDFAIENLITFITEDYEKIYAPLFQACVKNYCDKLLEFHNIDITNQIAQDFLTLRTVFSDFDETELLAKYPPELAEKLIFNNNNIQVLEKQNNNNFAFTINHHLYITKNPKNADFKISVDRNSNSKGTIIREIRNPNNTHIFSHGKLTKYIKEELEKRNILFEYSLSNGEIKKSLLRTH